MMAAADGSFGYEMEIIVPADSDLESPADLAGRTVTFTSPTSNSGFKAPSAILVSEFDLVADEDFDTVFSGAHDVSILGVANGDYEVASIANSVKGRMLDRGCSRRKRHPRDLPLADLPDHRLRRRLQPRAGAPGRVREAFFSFDWEGTELAEEFGRNGEDQFLEISYEEYWAVIRQIDRANGVVYTDD